MTKSTKICHLAVPRVAENLLLDIFSTPDFSCFQSVPLKPVKNVFVFF